MSYCKYCGAVLEGHPAVCSHCGAKDPTIGIQDVRDPVPPPQPPPKPQPQPQKARPRPAPAPQPQPAKEPPREPAQPKREPVPAPQPAKPAKPAQPQKAKPQPAPAPQPQPAPAPQERKGKAWPILLMIALVLLFSAASVVLPQIPGFRWPWEAAQPAVAEVTGLTAQPAYTNAARLRWDAAEGANGYQIFVLDRDSNEFVWLKNTPDTEVVNYTLAPDTVYQYRVRPYREDAQGSRVYGPFSETVSVRNMAVVTVTASPGPGKGEISLSWTPSPVCSGYQVFCVEANTGQEYRWLKQVDGLSCSHLGLRSGSTWYYKVRPIVDLPDGDRAYGQFSQVCHATAP